MLQALCTHAWVLDSCSCTRGLCTWLKAAAQLDCWWPGDWGDAARLWPGSAPVPAPAAEAPLAEPVQFSLVLVGPDAMVRLGDVESCAHHLPCCKGSATVPAPAAEAPLAEPAQLFLVLVGPDAMVRLSAV